MLFFFGWGTNTLSAFNQACWIVSRDYTLFELGAKRPITLPNWTCQQLSQIMHRSSVQIMTCVVVFIAHLHSKRAVQSICLQMLLKNTTIIKLELRVHCRQ